MADLDNFVYEFATDLAATASAQLLEVLRQKYANAPDEATLNVIRELENLVLVISENSK